MVPTGVLDVLSVDDLDVFDVLYVLDVLDDLDVLDFLDVFDVLVVLDLAKVCFEKISLIESHCPNGLMIFYSPYIGAEMLRSFMWMGWDLCVGLLYEHRFAVLIIINLTQIDVVTCYGYTFTRTSIWGFYQY